MFLGLPSGKIFDALGRIGKDTSKALNPETIQHAFDSGWINDWEYGFYMDTWRKRSLSARQEVVRQEINRKVLSNTSR